MESTHIALAADTATFCKAEINIGIMPTFGGTQRLPRNIGRKAAIELILTGRTFDAAEAARLGLINRVVPAANLLDDALALANLLATKPPLTLAAVLGAIRRWASDRGGRFRPDRFNPRRSRARSRIRRKATSNVSWTMMAGAFRPHANPQYRRLQRSGRLSRRQ